MHPEGIRSGKYSKVTDIWSFGVFLLEIFFQVEPLQGKDNTFVRAYLTKDRKTPLDWVVEGRPQVVPKCPVPNAILNVMRDCWKDQWSIDAAILSLSALMIDEELGKLAE